MLKFKKIEKNNFMIINKFLLFLVNIDKYEILNFEKTTTRIEINVILFTFFLRSLIQLIMKKIIYIDFLFYFLIFFFKKKRIFGNFKYIFQFF